MPIIVKDSGTGNFTPHPEGSFVGVCVDVHDLGEIETQWGKKRKVDIYFFCGLDKHDENGNEVTDDQGNRVHLMVRARFTPTLHESGNLRPFLERWRGRPFTDEELAGFDLEKLIGAAASLEIVHNKSGEKTYANIDYIKRAPKDEEVPAVPPEYVRFCDRPTEEAADPQPAGMGVGGSPFAERSDLPF